MDRSNTNVISQVIYGACYFLGSKSYLTRLSDSSIENEWKFQRRGKMLFAHSTNHSRGVLILINDELHIEIKNVLQDSDGRYIVVEAVIQDSTFLLVNLYAQKTAVNNVGFSKGL